MPFAWLPAISSKEVDCHQQCTTVAVPDDPGPDCDSALCNPSILHCTPYALLAPSGVSRFDLGCVTVTVNWPAFLCSGATFQLALSAFVQSVTRVQVQPRNKLPSLPKRTHPQHNICTRGQASQTNQHHKPAATCLHDIKRTEQAPGLRFTLNPKSVY